MALNLSRFGMAALFAVGMGFAAAGTAGAVTIEPTTSEFFADDGAPCVAGGNYDCVNTFLSINDIHTAEIDTVAADIGSGAGLFGFGFTATQNLSSVETNSLNPTTGFSNPRVEWNTLADGTGAVLAFLTSAQTVAGAALNLSFLTGETFFLITRWDDIKDAEANFDLRVSAVPLPPALLLLGSAMAGMGFLSRRRKFKATS